MAGGRGWSSLRMMHPSTFIHQAPDQGKSEIPNG